MMKKLLLSLGAAVVTSTAVVLAIGETESTENVGGKTNINKLNITYQQTVANIGSITSGEASTIKSGLENEIKTQLGTLDCEENIDYSIDNLDQIVEGVKITNISINVVSLQTSEKINGQTTINWMLKEDINNRVMEPFEIPANEKDALSQALAFTLPQRIKNDVSSFISQNQTNKLGTDYEINGLETIVVGASFDDYKNAISVKALPNSTKLTGSFQVSFS